MAKEILNDRYDFSKGVSFSDEEIEKEIQLMLSRKHRQVQCGNLLLVAIYQSDGSAVVCVSENYHQRTYKLTEEVIHG